jgi:hypothetical protein
MIARDDVVYLEAVEKNSFVPTGWLYRGIYERLLQRGLVSPTASYGYILSEEGARELAAWRHAEREKGS